MAQYTRFMKWKYERGIVIFAVLVSVGEYAIKSFLFLDFRLKLRTIIANDGFYGNYFDLKFLKRELLQRVSKFIYFKKKAFVVQCGVTL